MQKPWFLAVSLLLAASVQPAAAQLAGSCARPPVMALPSGAALDVESRSGSIEVVGGSPEAVQLQCHLNHPGDLGRIKVVYAGAANHYRLRVTGGPTHNDNFRLMIQLPTRSDLKLRVAAGEVKVSGIDGNKDVRVTAGEINLPSITSEKYREVSAAATIGEVTVPPSFPDKKAFLASFSTTATPAKYRVHAHVFTGEINFR